VRYWSSPRCGFVTEDDQKIVTELNCFNDTFLLKQPSNVTGSKNQKKREPWARKRAFIAAMHEHDETRARGRSWNDVHVLYELAVRRLDVPPRPLSIAFRITRKRKHNEDDISSSLAPVPVEPPKKKYRKKAATDEAAAASASASSLANDVTAPAKKLVAASVAAAAAAAAADAGDESEEDVPMFVGVSSMETSADDPRYCYCRQDFHGEMIGCDYRNCMLEWFHLPCVGLEEPPPEGEAWYCNECTVRVRMLERRALYQAEMKAQRAEGRKASMAKREEKARLKEEAKAKAESVNVAVSAAATAVAMAAAAVAAAVAAGGADQQPPAASTSSATAFSG
jgi:hypothetical protein